MNVADAVQSLPTRVLTQHWQEVIAGVAAMLVTVAVSVVTGTIAVVVVSGGIGGVVAGFSFGKHTTETTGFGYRVGVIGAILVVLVGLSLMAGGFWTLQYGPENLGVVGPPVEKPGADQPGTGQLDAEEPGTGEPVTGEPGTGESDPVEDGDGEPGVKEFSAETSMIYLLIFAFIFVPASALLSMIGTVIGTNVRQAVVPNKYNPPLF